MDALKDLEITVFTNHYTYITHVPIPVEDRPTGHRKQRHP